LIAPSKAIDLADAAFGLKDTVLGLSGNERQCHLDALANHIRGRLKARKFCVAFEQQLDLVWPRESMDQGKRKELILAFAEANGWEATIHDPGIRVTFREKQNNNK
jgi:hypothetical protein